MLKKIIAVIAAVSLTGCASIFAGGPAIIRTEVDADTDNVTVTTISSSGEKFIRRGRSNAFEAKRGDEYTVKIEAPGYETDTRTISKGLNVVTIVNLLFWPGFLIDLATGAIWDPQPKVMNVQLQKRR